MKIMGLQKLTLLDYPEKIACTVFLGGCNFRCPFCHNSSILSVDEEAISYDELMSFLKKRVGTLDGVAVTGGEPLLNDDIETLLSDIKSLGYSVKLDTNGSFPGRLKYLVEKGLVDYVAMDIKNSPSKYALTCGKKIFDISGVMESIKYLLKGNVPYEFRTTVVKELHEAQDFEQIGRMIAGADAYYLQSFIDSGDILCDGFSAHDTDELRFFRSLLVKYVPNTQLRGV